MFVTAPSVIFLEGKKEGGNSVHKNGLLFFPLIWDAIFFFHMAPNHFLPHCEAEYISRGATVGT